MKIIDIVHSFHDGKTRVSRGLCRVRSFVGESGTTVLLTDLGGKNDGQSVTNAVETVIDSLLRQGLVHEPAAFIEHYERVDPKCDTFDKVSLHPRTEWSNLSREDVLAILRCNQAELDDRSIQNKRIVEQADSLRFQRNPFVDSRYPDSNAVIARKLEINTRMISKSSISKLVQAGAGEQEIQRLLKTDLSVFGEAYAKPDDEYVCFSEFPVADGSVDFAVFTGRSRMDIILIEVKGAEFNLLNSNRYREFNYKILEAAGQIRSRLGVIYRSLDSFRKGAHQIRVRAENGEDVHNAMLGPYLNLQVDPDKDVNIRTVVIGGRMQNDLEESAKRQDYESTFTPPIRIESWDTWLRRLQRE